MKAPATKKMAPTVKQAWCDALRSQQYAQGQFRLRQRDKKSTPPAYCCLGVLCDLHAQSTGGEWEINNNPFKEGYYYLYEGDFSVLPATVREWSQVSEEVMGTLVRMNDTGSPRLMSNCKKDVMSFTEIAEWIEKHL